MAVYRPNYANMAKQGGNNHPVVPSYNYNLQNAEDYFYGGAKKSSGSFNSGGGFSMSTASSYS